MMKNWLLRSMLLPAVVDWLMVTETVSESYTSNIGGYVFTSHGLSVYLTKDEAKQWCTNNGSTLLEIKSSYVQTLTARCLSGTGVQFPDGILLFTNGMRTDGNWNWVNGQGINSITVLGQGPDMTNSFGYINFDPSSPRVFASTSTETRGYICQGKFDCTNGVLLNNLCHKRYISPTMSWFDARNKCLHDGGDLSSFNFINDDNGLNSALNGSWLPSSTTYWIGIRRQWWTWQTSNLEVNYTNWVNGRPLYLLGSQCLCIRNNDGVWNWIECNCNSPIPFVCLAEPPTNSPTSTFSIQLTTTTSSERASPSTISRSITAANLNTSTMEPQLSSASTMCNTDNRALAVGLGIGIPLVLIILALVVVIMLMKKKLSHHARLLASTTGSFDSVTHSQSAVKRNPKMDVNGTKEMVSEQNISAYESLQREAPRVSDQNYQELHISG